MLGLPTAGETMSRCYCRPGLTCMWHARESGRYWIDLEPSDETEREKEAAKREDRQDVGITRPER